ncbi:MAG: hypothetical protein U0457_05085 [Candidatus Sericytochromatia bacterium]
MLELRTISPVDVTNKINSVDKTLGKTKTISIVADNKAPIKVSNDNISITDTKKGIPSKNIEFKSRLHDEDKIAIGFAGTSAGAFVGMVAESAIVINSLAKSGNVKAFKPLIVASTIGLVAGAALENRVRKNTPNSEKRSITDSAISIGAIGAIGLSVGCAIAKPNFGKLVLGTAVAGGTLAVVAANKGYLN